MEAETGTIELGESASVVEAIATALAEGDDPMALTQPLSDSIDPDALETLVADSSGVEHVRFEHDGRIVDVHSDGAVTLTEPK